MLAKYSLTIVLVAVYSAGACLAADNATPPPLHCYVCDDCAQPFKPDPQLLVSCADSEVDGDSGSSTGGTTLVTTTPASTIVSLPANVTAPSIAGTTIGPVVTVVPLPDTTTASSIVIVNVTAPTSPTGMQHAPTTNTTVIAVPAPTDTTSSSTAAAPGANYTIGLPLMTNSSALHEANPSNITTPMATSTTSSVLTASDSPTTTELPQIDTTLEAAANGTTTSSNATVAGNHHVRVARSTAERAAPQLHQCYVIKHRDVLSGLVKVRRGCVRNTDNEEESCGLAKGGKERVQDCKLCGQDGCNAAGSMSGSLVLSILVTFAVVLWL